MQTLTKALPFALMLAAAPLWAQEAETPAEEQTAAEENAETPEAQEQQPATQIADGEQGLSMGTPEGGAASDAVGSTYADSTHGDWELRCVRAPEGQPDPCQLYQLLQDGQGNPVAEFNLFALPAGGQAVAGANVVTPLETLLTEQITVSVDGAQGKRYPFTFCTQIGCVSRIGFTQADVNQFKAGNAATLSIVPAGAPDQKVPLQLSLSGFTAGFTALQEKAAAAAAAAQQGN